ncbi:MAG: glycosyltransferase family A protein [Parvibaculum sp.]|nr:glycosyltransferase family A protein [Parvibaculum sp.]
MPKISCLIPLYRSRRFEAVITDNIDAIVDEDVEILVSDRHGEDDCLDRLRARYAGRRNIRFLAASDRADWVDNINGLMTEATGEYLRILPHDDSSTLSALTRLVDSLDSAPDAVLAYGAVEAVDIDNNRIPEKDALNANENPAQRTWKLQDALPLFWSGRFNGSFKGLVRTEALRRAGLHIRKTRHLVHSERTWLFGLALCGRFQFTPGIMLTKRYYETSTHRSWPNTDQIILDAADVMTAYSRESIVDGDARAFCIRDIYWNALRRRRRIESWDERYRRYLPYPDSRSAEFLNLDIASISRGHFAHGSGD